MRREGGLGGYTIGRTAYFAYYPMPTPRMLWPDAALGGGGTRITIHGDGFAAFGALDTTKCRFGAAIVHAKSKNASAIVCEAPPVALALPLFVTAPHLKPTHVRWLSFDGYVRSPAFFGFTVGVE